MIRTEAELEEKLSEPTPQVVETLGKLKGDILFLGAAGKMGPTLARMAKRASDAAGAKRRVIGVSRFSGGDDAALRAHGIETIRCDLLDEAGVNALPDAANIVYMPGRKFGTSSGDASATWAINCFLPAVVCRKYPKSKIVAFSTGNVYPFTPVASRGPTEAVPPNPVGEYGMSALGRERMFEYFSGTMGIPVAIMRLNYAVDLRYGVLVDLAKKILAGETIDLAMGHFNVIWQGDANAMTLRAFDHVASPPRVFNMTGPDVLRVRDVCERFGKAFDKEPKLTGQEAETALLSDATAGIKALGPLRVTSEELIAWVIDWLKSGGRLLDKPTHFEARDGKF